MDEQPVRRRAARWKLQKALAVLAGTRDGLGGYPFL
jgi:hypothetical protein